MFIDFSKISFSDDLREGKVRIIDELARKISERAREPERHRKA